MYGHDHDEEDKKAKKKTKSTRGIKKMRKAKKLTTNAIVCANANAMKKLRTAKSKMMVRMVMN